jgi:hypothetical protein
VSAVRPIFFSAAVGLMSLSLGSVCFGFRFPVCESALTLLHI